MTDVCLNLSKAETYELILKAQAGNREAKEILVEKNSGLVKKLAWKFSSCEIEREDLIQIGYIGLLKAISRFDCSYDVMFSTYAVPLILGEIKRTFRDGGKIKVSRSLKTEIIMMKKVKEKLSLQFGRSPKISELANEMNITPEHLIEISEAEKEVVGVISLETMKTENDMEEKVCSSPEENIDKLILREEIKHLKKTEQQVVMLRYYKDMTQSETGKVLGISQVQVSRIEKKVLEDIRKKMTE